MRYILDDNGYIDSVSCTPFNCKDKSCQEYTGAIPDGYSSIEEWACNANIRAYKIVSNNLTYDAARNAALEEEWSKPSGGIFSPKLYNVTGSAVSVPTATAKTIASITLPAGLYILHGYANIAGNKTGTRKIQLSETKDAYGNTRGQAAAVATSQNSSTMLNMSTIWGFSEETTIYLNAFQDSGSALSCNGSIRALRICDKLDYE